MNVRIVAGIFGGRIIEGSGTDRTHPMGERMKGSLFNILGDKLENAEVLDVFAGSGALGLEAISRGAKSAVLVERDRVAQNVIAANIKTLKVEKQAKLVKAPVASWLNTTSQQFDIIFVDPPYHDLQLSTVWKLVGLLKPKGLMVLSYPSRREVPTELGVVVVDNRSYGEGSLAFYLKEDV